MFDPIIILFVLTIALLEGMGGLPAGPQVDGLWLALFVNFSLLTIVGLAYAMNRLYLRRFDRTGNGAMMLRSYRLAALAKLLLGAHWLVSVLWFDWLGAVRTAVGGDLIVVDETLAVLPFLLALFLVYGLPHGMQQRVREASMARWLDQGSSVPPPVGFWGFVVEAVRHRAAIILVPVFLLSAVAEGLDRLFIRIARENPSFAESQWAQTLPPLAQTVLALVVLSLLPLLLRVLWRTSRLADGPTRSRLTRMCEEQGVKVRDILVWHTSSGMLNGALIGVVPRFRFILLTDGLLERLPATQLEAVMAHEIAHARRHHLPWLLGAMIALVTVCTTGLWLLARPFLLRIEDVQERVFWSDVVSGAALFVAMAVAFLCFGHISRRFERQADAFATQHLSGIRFNRKTPHPTDRCPVISGHAVLAMQRALSAVAAVGGIPPERFTFRHGSIAGRQRALSRLICRPAMRLPIDDVIKRIKIGTAIALVAAGILTAVQIQAEQKDAAEAREQMLREWRDQTEPLRWFRSTLERLP